MEQDVEIVIATQAPEEPLSRWIVRVREKLLLALKAEADPKLKKRKRRKDAGVPRNHNAQTS